MTTSTRWQLAPCSGRAGGARRKEATFPHQERDPEHKAYGQDATEGEREPGAPLGARIWAHLRVWHWEGWADLPGLALGRMGVPSGLALGRMGVPFWSGTGKDGRTCWSGTGRMGRTFWSGTGNEQKWTDSSTASTAPPPGSTLRKFWNIVSVKKGVNGAMVLQHVMRT